MAETARRAGPVAPVEGAHGDVRGVDVNVTPQEVAGKAAPRRKWRAVPAARSSRAIFHLRFWGIAGLLGALVLVSVVNIVASIGGGELELPPEPVGTGIAIAALDDVLAGRPLRVPHARDLAEYTQLQRVTDEDRSRRADEIEPRSLPGRHTATWDHVTFAEGLDGRTVEQHVFVVTTSRGVYTATVPVLPDEPPVLAALPSLAPYIGAGTRDVAGIGSVGTVPEAQLAHDDRRVVDETLNTWAAAYGADDRQALKTLTGDSRRETRYVGIGNYRPVTVTAVSTVTNEAQTMLLVRVDVTFVGPGDHVLPQSYDALVTEHTTSSPKVVAWGPAGSGPTLEQYGNATTEQIIEPVTEPDTDADASD